MNPSDLKRFALLFFVLATVLFLNPSDTLADTSEGEGEPAPPPAFTKADRFFKVIEERVPVYDNSTGTLIKSG